MGFSSYEMQLHFPPSAVIYIARLIVSYVNIIIRREEKLKNMIRIECGFYIIVIVYNNYLPSKCADCAGGHPKNYRRCPQGTSNITSMKKKTPADEKCTFSITLNM